MPLKKPILLHEFYKFEAWHTIREIKIRETNGRCEPCGGIGQEVHHKERLTVDNVSDVGVSLSLDILELLCRKCHKKEHSRFSKETQFDEKGNMIIR